MHLVNFGHPENYGIEIDAYGVVWNLHDSQFQFLRQDIVKGTVELRWELSEYHKASGQYPSYRFSILFSEVSQFEICPRDTKMPRNEDECLELFQRVDNPASLTAPASLGRSSMMPLQPDYLMLFEFHGGQKILIGAETATFVLLSNTDND